jgi:hypothetical protein
MKSARVSASAFVSAFMALFPGTLLSQAPSIQDYANACYAVIGDPKKAPVNPFTSNPAKTGLSCTTGTLINTGGALNAQGMCLSPSWASTHSTVPGGNVPFQCFPGSYVQQLSYTNSLDNSTTTGAVLCKNETPVDNGKFTGAGVFDYVSMILYNKTSGLSCWFTAPKGDAGVAPFVVRDGTNIPDPGVVGADNFWQAPQPTAAMNCWRCHDNAIWMNSPWFYVSNTPNAFTSLKNKPRGAPYGFATNTGNFGFQNWPVPVFVAAAAETCRSCHKIGAKQTANGGVSNTYTQWLGYVTGGSTSPVPNQAPVPQDPPGQIAGSATKQDAASWAVTHWMPEDNNPQAPAAYSTDYKADLLNLQSCMLAVGQFADNARRTKRDVLEMLKLINPNQQAFSITGDCHVDKPTFPGAQPAPPKGKVREAQPRRSPHPAVETTDYGLTLTAQLVGPDGSSLDEVTNMQPGQTPVNVPSGSSLTLSWDPGPNTGCSVLASFPPGVIVPTPQSSDGASSAGSGYNWLPGEGPEGIGPLTEPGVYSFYFDCGFQTEDEVTTQTFISLNLVAPATVLPNPPGPPLLMTIFTSTDSNYAQGVNWISYANPQNSYTSPVAPMGQIPQTNILAGPSDNVLLSWVAQDNLPGSCTLSELSAGGLSTITSDVGQTSVTLGSAQSRTFQLTCTDLNGGVDQLQTQVSGVPSIQLNPTTTPSSGVSDTDSVSITGSGSPSGTITPANVIVSFATSCGDYAVATTGVTSVALVTAIVATADAAPIARTPGSRSVIGMNGASNVVQFLIPGLDAGVYYVTISDLAAGDANFASGSCSMLTVADQ